MAGNHDRGRGGGRGNCNSAPVGDEMTAERRRKAEWLARYQGSIREIHALMEQRWEIMTIATKMTASISGMPKQEGATSRVEAAALKLYQLTEDFLTETDKLRDLRVEIENTINRVPVYVLRQVLWLRYVAGYGQKRIAKDMGYRYDYVRVLHGKALDMVEVPDGH